jgi:hypothetical protein
VYAVDHFPVLNMSTFSRPGKGIFLLFLAMGLLFVACTGEERAVNNDVAQLAKADTSSFNKIAQDSLITSFEQNYCTREPFKYLADSVSYERYNPDNYNPLFNAIYFYKKIRFITDTFCSNTFSGNPLVFRNSVRMDGCVYKTDELFDEVRFFDLHCDSSFRIQTFDILSEVRFTNCRFSDKMTMSLTWADTAFKSISFVSCLIGGDMVFHNWSYDFYGETIKQPVYAGDIHFSLIDFKGNLDMSHLTFKQNISFQQCNLPDTINFTGSNFKGEVRISPSRDGKKVNLLIDNDFPIQNLRCGATTYNLVFDSSISERTREYLLSQSVELQRKIGSSMDIEKADIDLKDYRSSRGDIFLKMQKFLWNYGYDKILLLKRILFSFILFFVLNLFLFRILIREVYTISNLKVEYDSLKNYTNRRIRYYKFPAIVFLYSSIIFFGWKMDLGKFSFRHLFLSLYVFLFYMLGLVLLFYFLGLILYRV